MNAQSIHFADPVMEPVLIPVEHKATPLCINDSFMVNGKPYGVTAMRLDSAFGAVVVEDVVDVDVASLGEALGNHPLFPAGANIVFIQVVDGLTIQARFWQLGKGEMDFTPEAACVAGITSIMLNKTIGRKVCVCMAGAASTVEWSWGRGVKLTPQAQILECGERYAS